MLGAQGFSGPDGYERSRPSRGPHPRPSGRGIRRARAAPATQPEARQRPEAGRAATGTAYPECLLGRRSSISRILGSPAAGAVPSGVPLPQQRQRLAGHVPLGERARVATDAPGPPGVGLRDPTRVGRRCGTPVRQCWGSARRGDADTPARRARREGACAGRACADGVPVVEETGAAGAHTGGAAPHDGQGDFPAAMRQEYGVARSTTRRPIVDIISCGLGQPRSRRPRERRR